MSVSYAGTISLGKMFFFLVFLLGQMESFEVTYNLIFQVWQYYLLPPEEQRMPGVKNPMCNAFPRVGRFGVIILYVWGISTLSNLCWSSKLKKRKLRTVSSVCSRANFCIQSSNILFQPNFSVIFEMWHFMWKPYFDLKKELDYIL